MDNKQIEAMRELIDYNLYTGIFTWKVKRNSFAGRVKLGSVAGCVKKIGYIYIGINGKEFLAHRLAWIFVNGIIPHNVQIDHINGSRQDNRICNLRLANNSQNQCNISKSKKFKNRTSSILGVSWDTNRKKWVAQIVFNKKKKFLGYFDSELEAGNAYCRAKKEIHGEFSGFFVQ